MVGARPSPPVQPGLLERTITQGIVLFHPQRYLHFTKATDSTSGKSSFASQEPFYKKGGSPALDAEYVTDESFEHEDTRAHNLWPGGKPFDQLDFGFGPLNTDCLLNHLKMGWDVVWAWFTFWFPWLLDWAVAPFMGIVFYCALTLGIVSVFAFAPLFSAGVPRRDEVWGDACARYDRVELGRLGLL